MEKSRNITDAEWQVMRIIWAEGCVTSRYLIETLQKSREWSPTTVKTLLARLVKKEIIGYTVRGRAREYTANILELDCVRNEMNNVIMRLYGGEENKRTDHFVFYGENDRAYLELLANELEENYTGITESVGYYDHSEIMVYTHESKARLQSALGVANGPSWLRGGLAWGVIHIAPYDVFDDIRAEKVALHLLAQAAMDRVNRNLPYWLFQGAAAYLSKWLSFERVSEAVRKFSGLLIEGDFSHLSSDYEIFRNKMGYELSYTIAEYIMEEHGHEGLSEFIRHPEEYRKVFGCKKDEFRENWSRFIKSKYMEG